MLQKITRIPLKFAPLISTLTDEEAGRIFKRILYIDGNLYAKENILFELMMTDINAINKKAGDGNRGGRPKTKPKVIENGNLRLGQNEENTKPSKDKLSIDKINKDKIKEKKNIKKDFSSFWDIYPIKKGKQKAESKYLELVKSGISHDKIIEGVNNYIKEYELLHKLKEFCPEYKHPSTWLNQGCREDEYKTEVKQFIKKKKKIVMDTHFLDDIL